MLWSRTLLPHAVMTLTPNGTLQQMHHTSNPEVFAHLRHVCGKGVWAVGCVWAVYV